jgi:hypothetical protein
VNQGKGKPVSSQQKIGRKKMWPYLFRFLFLLLNLPVTIVWKVWLKQKVWEPEFMATFRFGFALFSVPVYYLLLALGLALWINSLTAMMSVIGLFLFNWAYVKWA